MAVKLCRCCPTVVTLRHSRHTGITLYFICSDCRSRPDRIRKLFVSLTHGANRRARGGKEDAGDLKSPGIKPSRFESRRAHHN